MPQRNRTIDDSGVRLAGSLFDVAPITGTGVTTAQAIAVTGPLTEFLESLPYYLDERGTLAYRSGSLALHHPPELRYGPGHPQAGELIFASGENAAYVIKHGGAPMPFIDLDTVSPHALAQLLTILTEAQAAMLNAT